MNNDVYFAITDRIKEIAGADDGRTHAFIEDIMAVCKTHSDEGFDIPSLSLMLVSTSLSIMALCETLEECEHFAKTTRNIAETERKIIRDHWPPADQKRWPYS